MEEIRSFAQWQARELRLRDMLLLATFVVGHQLYAAKVNNAVCLALPTPSSPPVCPQRSVPVASVAVQPVAATAWGLAERLSCGCAIAPRWLHDVEPVGASHKVLHTVAGMLVQAANRALQVRCQLPQHTVSTQPVCLQLPPGLQSTPWSMLRSSFSQQSITTSHPPAQLCAT